MVFEETVAPRIDKRQATEGKLSGNQIEVRKLPFSLAENEFSTLYRRASSGEVQHLIDPHKETEILLIGVEDFKDAARMKQLREKLQKPQTS